MNLRILWLKTELLHPLDKGGKIRTYNMLRQLTHEHEITYLTLDDGVDKRAGGAGLGAGGGHGARKVWLGRRRRGIC